MSGQHVLVSGDEHVDQAAITCGLVVCGFTGEPTLEIQRAVQHVHQVRQVALCGEASCQPLVQALPHLALRGALKEAPAAAYHRSSAGW